MMPLKGGRPAAKGTAAAARMVMLSVAPHSKGTRLEEHTQHTGMRGWWKRRGCFAGFDSAHQAVPPWCACPCLSVGAWGTCTAQQWAGTTVGRWHLRYACAEEQGRWAAPALAAQALVTGSVSGCSCSIGCDEGRERDLSQDWDTQAGTAVRGMQADRSTGHGLQQRGATTARHRAGTAAMAALLRSVEHHSLGQRWLAMSSWGDNVVGGAVRGSKRCGASLRWQRLRRAPWQPVLGPSCPAGSSSMPSSHLLVWPHTSMQQIARNQPGPATTCPRAALHVNTWHALAKGGGSTVVGCHTVLRSVLVGLACPTALTSRQRLVSEAGMDAHN